MSESLATVQANDILPPRLGKICALSVDSTARSYDLTAIAFGATYRPSSNEDAVYLRLANDGTQTVYVAFNTVTDSSLDDTAKTSAGGTLAFGAAAAACIFAGVAVDFRIRRNVDKFIQVKTASSTSTLRIWASTPANPGAI